MGVAASIGYSNSIGGNTIVNLKYPLGNSSPPAGTHYIKSVTLSPGMIVYLSFSYIGKQGGQGISIYNNSRSKTILQSSGFPLLPVTNIYIAKYNGPMVA
jgi:hypothetical protein